MHGNEVTVVVQHSSQLSHSKSDRTVLKSNERTNIVMGNYNSTIHLFTGLKKHRCVKCEFSTDYIYHYKAPLYVDQNRPHVNIFIKNLNDLEEFAHKDYKKINYQVQSCERVENINNDKNKKFKNSTFISIDPYRYCNIPFHMLGKIYRTTKPERRVTRNVIKMRDALQNYPFSVENSYSSVEAFPEDVFPQLFENLEKNKRGEESIIYIDNSGSMRWTRVWKREESDDTD